MINQLDFNGGRVFATAKLNGILYIGGYFSSVNGQTRNNFAAIDLATGDLLPLNLFFNNPILAIEPCGSNLAIGGPFSQPLPGVIIYNPADGSYYSILESTGFVFTTIASPPIYSMAYHVASDVLYFSGYVYVSSQAPTTGYGDYGLILGVHIATKTLKPFSLGFQLPAPPMNPASISSNSLSIDQDNSILYATCGGGRSFSISDPDNISIYSWMTPTNKYPLKVYYSSPYTYYVSLFSSYSGSVENIFITTDPVTGAINSSMDTSIFKASFNGNASINAVIQSGNYLYVAGIFDYNKLLGTPIKKSSFTIFDLGNNGNIVGDNIDFNKWTTINYPYPASFQSLQPPLISAMVLDDNKVHLFGTISSVDGKLTNKGHYILNADGTRISNKIVF